MSKFSNLTKEELLALAERQEAELGDVLRGIHNRLISEGYEIKDGCITKKPQE